MAEGVSVEGGGRLRPFLLLIFELGAVGRDAVLSANCRNAQFSNRRVLCARTNDKQRATARREVETALRVLAGASTAELIDGA